MSVIYAIGHRLTIIMVAHRLNTLTSCDRIMTVEQGAVRSN